MGGTYNDPVNVRSCAPAKHKETNGDKETTEASLI